MLYYFDETGDQGYVDKSTSMSDYGILAGIAFPERIEDNLENKLNGILASLDQGNFRKLHCTEIFKNNSNERLREELYNTLLGQDEYLIIHEGAYSIGIRQNDELLQHIIDRHTPDTPDNIKTVSFKSRTRLYTTLLTGIIVKLEECAINTDESEVHMVSDQIDKKIQKESLSLLTDLQTKSKEVISRSFNTETSIRREQHYQIEMDSELAAIEKVKDITYLNEVNPLSFAADFVCFELLRHFRRKMKIIAPIDFHSKDALDGFRLKQKVAFLGDDYFTDLVFKPKANG